jgi:branched-chain amino acid transport system permease protein
MIIGTAYEVAAPVTMLVLVLIYRQHTMRRNRQVLR